MSHSSPGPADLTGTLLAGRYRILRKLGEGAMGAVYVGEHLRIGRLDAIKVLLAASTDAEAVARFNRGARNLSAIRHPNVCTLYDYGETADGSPFLALELIEGESLKDRLEREGPLPLPRAIVIVRQIAAALQAAHDAGIVHRDLKPGNIMIERGRDGSDVVKVVDFDIAKASKPVDDEELTRMDFIVGTPEYTSPEQLLGERLDGRSDIYSLGLVFFRVLTGVLPFRGENTQEIMLRRLTHQPLGLKDVSQAVAGVAGLQAVLDRALARDRDERFSTAAEFAAALGDLRAGEVAAIADSGLVEVGPGQGAERIPETVAIEGPDGAAPAPPRAFARWWWLTVPAVLLAAITYALWPSPSAPPPPGSVVIAGALPDGALVTCTDAQGNVIPVSTDSIMLAPGTYTFVFAAPGYESDSARLDITAAQRHSWSPRVVTIAPAPLTGVIAVSGDLPAGAAVTARDARGNETDLTSGSATVRPGRYVLEFSAPGHLAERATVDVEPDDTVKWTPRRQLPEPAMAISVRQAEQVLSRLTDRLGNDLTRRTALAAVDTARWIFEEMPAATGEMRAQAAAVVALAYFNLRDATACTRWVNLAAEQDPDFDRDVFLSMCSGGRP